MSGSDEPVRTVRCQDAELRLYRDRLELSRRGVSTMITRGLSRSAAYPMEQVRNIEIVYPSKQRSSGYAHIQVQGDFNKISDRTAAAKHQDSVMLFNRGQADAVSELWTTLQDLMRERGIASSGAPVMEVAGSDGFVTLLADRIVLSQKGNLSKLVKGAAGALEIRLSHITGVQLKRPGVTKGYIQFMVPGHQSTQQGIFGAVRDELSVAIANKKQFEQFLALKNKLEQLQIALTSPTQWSAGVATPMSVADELEKLSSLLDRGIITPDEFNRQKVRVLDRQD